MSSDITLTPTAPVAGPLLTGFLLNTGLFGILVTQICTYHVSFPDDRPRLKLLVYAVFLGELAQTTLTLHDAYWIFVAGFGNTSILLSTGRMGWIYAPLIGGTLIFTVHLFYTHRIRTLYKSWTLGCIISTIAVVRYAAGLASSPHFRMQESLDGYRVDGHYPPVLIWAVASPLCDIIISGCMTLWLHRWGDTGSKSTRTTVARLLWLTIESAIILATSEILGLILFLGFPKRSYYLVVFIAPSKWHSVVLFASLNTRSRNRRPEPCATMMDVRFQTLGTETRVDPELGVSTQATSIGLARPQLVHTSSVSQPSRKW